MESCLQLQSLMRMTTKYVEAKDTLEKNFIGQDIEGDVEAQELANVLNISNLSMCHKFVEPLNRVLGPPPKPSIEEAQKLELKLSLVISGMHY